MAPDQLAEWLAVEYIIKNKEKRPLQYLKMEKVTIEIPTVLLSFLREHEKVLEETVEQYLQRSIVHCVRALLLINAL